MDVLDTISVLAGMACYAVLAIGLRYRSMRSPEFGSVHFSLFILFTAFVFTRAIGGFLPESVETLRLITLPILVYAAWHTAKYLRGEWWRQRSR